MALAAAWIAGAGGANGFIGVFTAIGLFNGGSGAITALGGFNLGAAALGRLSIDLVCVLTGAILTLL
jgi:hypothetical protein